MDILYQLFYAYWQENIYGTHYEEGIISVTLEVVVDQLDCIHHEISITSIGHPRSEMCLKVWLKLIIVKTLAKKPDHSSIRRRR